MKELFEKYNITLNSRQEEKFKNFLSLFMQKNQEINLSAIRDEKSIIEKHFIDSLMITHFVNLF
jgi:16S rRNA (guanine527-N7)-methyltransferase